MVSRNNTTKVPTVLDSELVLSNLPEFKFSLSAIYRVADQSIILTLHMDLRVLL